MLLTSFSKHSVLIPRGQSVSAVTGGVEYFREDRTAHVHNLVPREIVCCLWVVKCCILYILFIFSFNTLDKGLKGGDRRVRIFSAHNDWWATPEVSLPLPYQRSAKVFLNLLRQGVKTMYYFKNMDSKSLKCAK